MLSEQDLAHHRPSPTETIRKTIARPIAFNDREIFLTASIAACAVDPQTQPSPDEIITDARACDVFTPSGSAATAATSTSRDAAARKEPDG